jgi:hypothetical protein
LEKISKNKIIQWSYIKIIKMKLNFKICKGSIIIPINMGTLINLEDIASRDLVEKYHSSNANKGIIWTYRNKEIIIEDKNIDIIGYPTLDYKYIVAIYLGNNNKFPPPCNAVIFNIDGSIHKIIDMPILKSHLVTERIIAQHQRNPPLENPDLYFSGFCWSNPEIHKIINLITITYNKDLWESRVLDPESGEVGELIYYGKY